MMFFTPGSGCRAPSPPTASRTRALIFTSTLVTPGTLQHRGARLIAHLVLHRTRRRRELDGERDAAAVDRQILDEAEAHDVAVQIRIAHDRQRIEHRSAFKCHGSNGIGFGWPRTRNGTLRRMAEGAPNRSAMLVLAYMWPLAVIPLFLTKDDAEVQWHAKHGLVLMAAELALLLGLSILMQLLMVITFGVGCLASIAFVFLWAGVLVLHVFAIVRALNGYRLVIPGVSAYASRF